MCYSYQNDLPYCPQQYLFMSIATCMSIPAATTAAIGCLKFALVYSLWKWMYYGCTMGKGFCCCVTTRLELNSGSRCHYQKGHTCHYGPKMFAIHSVLRFQTGRKVFGLCYGQ